MPIRLLHGAALMEYHHKLMPFAWSIFIDVSIFAALYSHKPYALTTHVIGAATTGAITIVTSFASFLKGIPSPGNPMRTHKLTGFLLYCLIATQIIIGILWWFMRTSPKGSQWSLRFKKMHKALGYTIAVIAKLQVLFILPSSGFLFWFNLLWDLITIILLIRAKKSKERCEKSPELRLKTASYRLIKNLSEIESEHHNVFTYGNYVFKCESMKNKHPAGYQLILQSKYQCIDRYLYGMMAPESMPTINFHSHSARSLEFIDKPIAKLQVPEQFLNFSSESYQVQIHSVDLICSKSSLNLVKLNLLQNERIEYKGYSELEQLGRYYSLTLNKEMTRLYSTVNFLNEGNVSFVLKALPHTVMPYRQKEQMEEESSLEIVSGEELHSKENMIHLLIKKYHNGRFTKKLLENVSNQLELSCSKGRGLDLSNVQDGKIILVAGGTGLLPFCDLIDLLFKQELIKRKPFFRDEVLSRNKILRQNFLERNSFVVMIAVNHLSEIHPIILSEMRYLAQNSDKIDVHLRIKEESIQLQKIKMQNESFDVILEEWIRNESIAKIIVCGPTKLNQSMTHLFNKTKYSPFMIL